MLVTNNIKPGSIVTLKLNTGEEIIAKLSNRDNNTYEITNPMMLVMTTIPMEDFDEQGNRHIEKQGQVSFVPWLLSVVENIPITIHDSKIITCIQTSPLAAAQYNAVSNNQTIKQNTPPQVIPPTTGNGIAPMAAGRGRY